MILTFFPECFWSADVSDSLVAAADTEMEGVIILEIHAFLVLGPVLPDPAVRLRETPCRRTLRSVSHKEALILECRVVNLPIYGTVEYLERLLGFGDCSEKVGLVLWLRLGLGLGLVDVSGVVEELC